MRCRAVFATIAAILLLLIVVVIYMNGVELGIQR